MTTPASPHSDHDEKAAFEAIFDALEAPEIDVAWKNTAAEIDATPEMRKEAIAWVRNHRNFFVQALRDVNDPIDLRLTLALRYIELKSVWIQFNTTINYCLMNKGEADPRSLLCSSLISQLLISVESLLKPEEVEQISNFLNTPINV